MTIIWAKNLPNVLFLAFLSTSAFVIHSINNEVERRRRRKVVRTKRDGYPTLQSATFTIQIERILISEKSQLYSYFNDMHKISEKFW